MNIKKIIREEIESSLGDWGWAHEIEIPSAYDWLKDNFSNLEELIDGSWVYYLDSRQRPIFTFNKDDLDDGTVLVAYGTVWSKLEKDFGLNDPEIQHLIRSWLKYEDYDLKGVTPNNIRKSHSLDSL